MPLKAKIIATYVFDVLRHGRQGVAVAHFPVRKNVRKITNYSVFPDVIRGCWRFQRAFDRYEVRTRMVHLQMSEMISERDTSHSKKQRTHVLFEITALTDCSSTGGRW